MHCLWFIKRKKDIGANKINKEKCRIAEELNRADWRIPAKRNSRADFTKKVFPSVNFHI
jgi:hypothetical protein